MRRMYSEQELSIIIHDVVGDYIEDGAFDESIASAVDAYLTEHPVDITALEGQDVELNSLDATGLVTAGELLEKMSGYSFAPRSAVTGLTITTIYAGVVKTGNKLTIVQFFSISKSSEYTGGDYANVGTFSIPADISAKILPITGISGDLVAMNSISLFTSSLNKIDKLYNINKYTNNLVTLVTGLSSMTEDTNYYGRIEATFLLSENLAS